jgi:hypothetical protein
MAAGVAGVSMQDPPRLMERLLLRLLPVRDRETISGDLLEEYREERLPQLGRLRAGFWYLRQVVSFFPKSIQGGVVMKQVLMTTCWFGVVAGAWLGVMENVLKHQGYETRTLVAACIVAQGLATLACLALRGGVVFRSTLVLGAAGMMWLGASAIWKMLSSPHFEGFVVVIGTALILQAFATFILFLTTGDHAIQN